MSLVASSYIFVGSVCLTISLLHLAIFLRRTESKVQLIFAIMALSCAVASVLQIWMDQAADVATYVFFSKSSNTFQVILWISFLWFIRYYTGNNRRRFIHLISGLYAVAGLLNIIFPHGILFDHIDHLEFFSLPWGGRIAFAIGQSTLWRLLPDAAWILLLAYALDSCIHLGRQGQKRRAIFFGSSLFACLGIGYLNGTLIDLGLIPPPSIWHITFLALIVLMSGALVGQVIQVPMLKRQLSFQETRWKNLLGKSRMLVLGADSAGRIHFVNSHFLTVTGFSEAEVTGRPVAKLIPEIEKEGLTNQVQESWLPDALRTTSPLSLVTKGGALRMIRWSHVYLDNSEGVPSEFLIIGEDVTDLEKAHQALADEKERMDVILSTLNTGLVLIDPDMTVVWANATLKQMFPDCIGKKCHTVAENRATPCEGCQSVQVFRDGAVHEREFVNAVNGRWYHVVAQPIKDETGQVIMVLEATTDINERKLTEEARDRAIEELEALKNRVEGENIYLKSELEQIRFAHKIIGKSSVIHYVLSRLHEVAETNATVLIQGETGVGKELVAMGIHEASGRARRPFIKLNCAALPQNLVESELFGHEKGAFTGAEGLRKGRFELADQGTIFLDEISEMPMDVQAKLLNVLQDGEFYRVGGRETMKVDVRVVAATNRNLGEDVQAGRFRADLYYRLNVYPITVPPLRKRKDDIPLLVDHFVPLIASRIGKHIDQIPSGMMDRLIVYDWPGNVRELRNVLERAVITSPDNVLHLPAEFESEFSKSTKDAPEALISLEEFERRYILKVLDKTGGRLEGSGGAAEILQLKPSTLRFRINKLGIKRKKLRNGEARSSTGGL